MTAELTLSEPSSGLKLRDYQELFHENHEPCGCDGIRLKDLIEGKPA